MDEQAPKNELFCKHLTLDGVDVATEIAYAAYHDYPLFTIVRPDFADDASFDAYLKVLLRVTIRSHILTHPGFLFRQGKEIVGLLLLEGPEDKDSGIIGYAKSGGFDILFRRGFKNTFAYLDLIEADEAFVRAIPFPHWHVEMLTILPDYQGQGIGRKIIHDVIEPYVINHGSTYLTGTTNTEENVELYKHWGFEVLHEEEVSYKNIPLKNWVIGKELQPANTNSDV